MKYVVSSNKTVAEATTDLEAAVKRNGFGVLHTYDLKETLAAKGAPIDRECRILEVCNPIKAREVLNADMSMNMALPCRVSVYEDDGGTKLGLISPKALLGMLSDSTELGGVADEVETKLRRMLDEAR